MFSSNHRPGSDPWTTWITATVMWRHSIEPVGYLIYHSHYSRYQNFARDIDPWMSPWINHWFITSLSISLTGKFPLLVSVLWYPTRCSFTMHCLQNILDTFIIPRGPRAYLPNHRGVISHLRTLGYTHTLKPPSDCRFDTQLRPCHWQYQSNSSSMHNPNNLMVTGYVI